MTSAVKRPPGCTRAGVANRGAQRLGAVGSAATSRARASGKRRQDRLRPMFGSVRDTPSLGL